MAQMYEIYGRREQDQALTWLATMDVDGDVKEAVQKAHGDDWLELVAIPSGSIGWAIEEKA